jgi:CRISPR/Cas system CSM-associated protein Csm3 (group 7 of RAMP superfamily)
MSVMFDQLQRILVIPVEFTTWGNLSINSGRDDGARDSLVIREGGPYSNPVLSGSSLKGVVRSHIEAQLSAAGKEVCLPPTCFTPDPQGRGSKKPDSRRDPRDCAAAPVPCRVCQLFGNTRQAGRALFQDARANPGHRVTTLERTHVALTRDTRVAGKSDRGGALVTMETIAADEVFGGRVVLLNPEGWMAGAILSTLERLPLLGVGAKRTSGYGTVTVEIGELKVETYGKDSSKVDFKNKSALCAEWDQLIGRDGDNLRDEIPKLFAREG